jgi:hypothetical protein
MISFFRRHVTRVYELWSLKNLVQRGRCVSRGTALAHDEIAMVMRGALSREAVSLHPSELMNAT